MKPLIIFFFTFLSCFFVSAQKTAEERKLDLDLVESSIHLRFDSVNVKTRIVIDQITITVDTISGDTLSIDTTLKNQYQWELFDTLLSGSSVNYIIPWEDSIPFVEYYNGALANRFQKDGKRHGAYITQKDISERMNKALNQIVGRKYFATRKTAADRWMDGTWKFRYSGSTENVDITNARGDDPTGTWVAIDAKIFTIQFNSAPGRAMLTLKIESPFSEMIIISKRADPREKFFPYYEGEDKDGKTVFLGVKK